MAFVVAAFGAILSAERRSARLAVALMRARDGRPRPHGASEIAGGGGGLVRTRQARPRRWRASKRRLMSSAMALIAALCRVALAIV